MDRIVFSIGEALRTAFGIFWEILWPLILGFPLSGAVQAVYRTLQLPGELELLPPPV